MSERQSSKKLKTSDSSLGHDLNDSGELPESEFDSAISHLEMVHIELDKLNDRENEEVLSIGQKYKKLRQEFYNRRSEIVELIPDFWPTVFTSHPTICCILFDDEEDCLRHLQKLEVETPDNVKTGYSIKLFFTENPYFKNDSLIKEFFYDQGRLQSISTKIDWKRHPVSGEGSSSSFKNGKKRCSLGQTFFSWFENNEDAANDYIAEIIKDDIWVNSLHYYLVPDPDMEGNNDRGCASDTTSSDCDEDSAYDPTQERGFISRPSGSGEAGTSK